MNIEDKRVLVIGDICLDKFVYCNVERMCPEAPVPLLKQLYYIENLGMSGNVASNLLSLGITCDLITPDRNQYMSRKTRYVDEKTNYMFYRIDEDSLYHERFDINKIDLSKYDAVVISDYNKGFLEKEDICEISDVCKSINIPTFVDTKKPIGDWANPTFYKINEKEWINSTKYKNENVIVTLGSGGCMYKDSIFNTTEHNSFDVSGAGDTFLATLVAGYAMEYSIEMCLYIANIVAGEVVCKKGVSTPSFKITKYKDDLFEIKK